MKSLLRTWLILFAVGFLISGILQGYVWVSGSLRCGCLLSADETLQRYEEQIDGWVQRLDK